MAVWIIIASLYHLAEEKNPEMVWQCNTDESRECPECNCPPGPVPESELGGVDQNLFGSVSALFM